MNTNYRSFFFSYLFHDRATWLCSFKIYYLLIVNKSFNANLAVPQSTSRTRDHAVLSDFNVKNLYDGTE